MISSFRLVIIYKMREISDKKLAEIWKECHEADEMIDKANDKLVIML